MSFLSVLIKPNCKSGTAQCPVIGFAVVLAFVFILARRPVAQSRPIPAVIGSQPRSAPQPSVEIVAAGFDMAVTTAQAAVITLRNARPDPRQTDAFAQVRLIRIV